MMTSRSTTCSTPGAAALPSVLQRARRLMRAALARARGPAPAAEELVLEDWQAQAIAVGRARLELRVLEGEVLVTAEGDLVDHVVRAGEAFRSDRRGRHVVAGLGRSRVVVSRAA